MAKTKLKAQGRHGGEGERFARMPDSLLQHIAVTTLSHSAFRVLTVLTVGARPPSIDRRKDIGRNGVQAITDSYARKYGLNSRDTVYRALDELRERGLIVQTRDGHKSKTHFALYAVAWLPITHREGQPLDQAEPPPQGFMNWTPPPKAKKVIGKKLEMPSDDRTQSRPIAGDDAHICRPIVGLSNAICRPIAGSTLRVLGSYAHDADAASGSIPSDSGPNAASQTQTAIFPKNGTAPTIDRIAALSTGKQTRQITEKKPKHAMGGA